MYIFLIRYVHAYDHVIVFVNPFALICSCLQKQSHHSKQCLSSARSTNACCHLSAMPKKPCFGCRERRVGFWDIHKYVRFPKSASACIWALPCFKSLHSLWKNNQTSWRWRQPCLEPCASVLHPYCTVNKLGLRERSGRRDSKAAEIGRPWGTEGPEGADHPSVVVWPPGVPVGDHNHPHDPAVSRTETLSGTPHTHAFGTLEDGSSAEEEGKSKIFLGSSLHVAPFVPLLKPTFSLA